MTYKYYNLSPPLSDFASASSVIVSQFQALITEQFSVASDVFDIYEESTFASGSYICLQARVNDAINTETGEKLGDDFKILLFSDINHLVSIGKKYYFNDNHWVTVFTKSIKNLTANCTVRRCNNVLRWISSGSEVLEEPCAIEYKTNNPRDDIPNTNLVTPGGYMTIYTQLNDRTIQIKDGQRFLFGNTHNWSCFKVFGGGVRNYTNQSTEDNSSAKLLKLEVQTNFVNEDTDDILLGIADRYLYPTSASSVANIVVIPNSGSIIEGELGSFDVRLYSGSMVTSASFVFTVSGSNVPIDHYTFTTLTNNTFSVLNNEKYLDYPLEILCSASSGSRIFEIELRGDW